LTIPPLRKKYYDIADFVSNFLSETRPLGLTESTEVNEGDDGKTANHVLRFGKKAAEVMET